MLSLSGHGDVVTPPPDRLPFHVFCAVTQEIRKMVSPSGKPRHFPDGTIPYYYTE